MNSSVILRCIKNQCELITGIAKQVTCYSTKPKISEARARSVKVSPRMAEFRKKLQERTETDDLDEISSRHPFQEKEPLKRWPNNVNPHTGEIGGPAGPEPTRYGDWERKGRAVDF